MYSFSQHQRAAHRARYVSRILQREHLEARFLLAGDMVSSWQNAQDCNDVNLDSLVTPLDALQVIRSINIDGSRPLPESAEGEPGGSGPSYLMIDTNGDGHLSPRDALQIIDVLNAQGEGESIRVRVEATDLDGNVIDTVQVGDAFQLRTYVQDLRDGDEAQGVFAAYVDVAYDASSVSVAGTDPVTFTSNYPNGISGNFQVAGLMDEVGAFSNATPLGASEHLLFTVSMRADAGGTVTFTPDAADNLPAHETLFFGTDDTVDGSEILFDSATLSIVDNSAPSDLVQFAKDLAAAGVEFWSTNQASVDAVSQRALFEDGANYLPTRAFFDANGNVSSEATDESVSEVNTWIFPDASRATGVLSLQEISSRSGVPIPAAGGPSLREIVDSGAVTVEFASPRHLPLDGYDPWGQPLTYSVNVEDAGLVEAGVVQGNRYWSLEVEGYGTMVLELFEDKASRATNQFIELTEEGFYDGIIFHRVIPNFVIQGGDPLGNGTGGSLKADFDDQFHVDLRHNQVGVLSMAKSADDTNNSQFFVTHRETPHLDFNHTVFGQLIEGFDVLEGITNAPTGLGDKPLNDIVISKATVFEDTENAVLQVRALDSTGTTTVTVTATDSLGNQTTQTFDVTLASPTTNAQVFLDDIPTFSAPAGATQEFQLSYTDIEDDSVFFFADPVTPGIQSDVSDSGLVSVQIPADAVPGSQILVDVTASESSVLGARTNFDRQRVAITVEAAAGDGVDDEFIVEEDSSDNLFDVLANDGLDESASIISVTGAAIHGTATIAADGKTILYSPEADFFGEATFSYTATTENDGTFSANVTVTVNNVLDPPVANDDVFPEVLDANDPNRELYVEDSAGDIPLTRVLINDLNADGEEQELTTITAVTDPEFGTITWNAIQIRYTPAPDFFGSDSFTYTTTGLTTGLSATGTITVNIAEQNDPPVPANDTRTAVPGSTTILPAIELFQNDRPGPDNESGQSLRIIEIEYQGSGTAVINDDGDIEYTPGPGFVGSETIVYTASDDGTTRGQADPQTATAAVTVRVESSGIAVDDSFRVDFESTGNVLNVLANDDRSGGATIVNLTEPANGSAALADGQIEYTPNLGYVGADSFTYTLRDDNGAEASATVAITVVAEETVPVAVDDAFTVVAPGVQTYHVLANDSGHAGRSLTITQVDDGDSRGQVAISLDGLRILYTPDFSAAGTDTFSYTIDDGTGQTSQATVTVSVPDLVGESFFAGSIFTDRNDNGFRDAGERGLGGVTVVLNGTDTVGNSVRRETKTSLAGAFRFEGIGPGNYTVSEQQPPLVNHGRNVLGSIQVASDDLALDVTEQLITSGGNSFGERGLHPQFALINALSSSRGDGLLVVLADDDLAWAEDQGGWSSVQAIAISQNADVLSLETADLGSRQLDVGDRSIVQLLGRSREHTLLRIRGTSQQVLTAANVDQILTQ